MNNGNELVSVYIPTHNRVDMLERAIMSVLKQSYPNIEIIVSDDGSQDNTKKIVTSYMQQYSNIKYVFSSEAKGACHARNLAIAKASGTYITGLDDDDEFTQDRIEELVNFWKENPNFSFLCTAMQVITKNGKFIKFDKRRKISLNDCLNENIIGNQVFTKTSTLKSIKGFDPEMPSLQDYECWIRLCSNFGDGYSLGSPTYILHTEHEKPRITNNDKLRISVSRLMNKHSNIMSVANKKNLDFIFYYYISKNVTFNCLLRNLTKLNLYRYFKFKLKAILIK